MTENSPNNKFMYGIHFGTHRPILLRDAQLGDRPISVHDVLVHTPANADLIALYPTQQFTANWEPLGNCATRDSDERFVNNAQAQQEAKKICVGCPVLIECLVFGLGGNQDEKRPQNGVYGCLTERERGHAANRNGSMIGDLQRGINNARQKQGHL